MPEPYEINTQKIRESGQPNLIRDLLRGLIADTRGMLETRQMRRHAADAKSKQIADEAYRQRMAAVQEKRLRIQGEQFDLDTDKFEEQKRIQQETEAAQKEKESATEELKTEYARAHDEFFNMEREYIDSQGMLTDEDNEELNKEIEHLRSRLTKTGAWLKRNAEAAGFPEFSRLDALLEGDEEASKEAETQEKQAQQSERTLQAINDPEIFSDEAQRTKLAKLHAANPDMPLKELIDLAEATDPEDDKTETIRTDKLTVWNAEKAKIIEQHGEGLWQAVAGELKYSETPEAVDINKYIQKPKPDKPDKEEPNPHIQKGEDAYAAALALGDSPAIAEEKKKTAIGESLKSDLGEEQGALIERAMHEVKQIRDDQLRIYTLGVPIDEPSSRKIAGSMFAIAELEKEGQIEEAYSALGDIWTGAATKVDKSADSRLQDAMIFQNMRGKLEELKTEYGIETGRVSQKYLDLLSTGNFTAAAHAFAFEAVGADLTPEQQTALSEANTYIRNNFAIFLNRISGTAASDVERQDLVAINPNLFMQEGINIGIIDGNINYLRDREFALFTKESNREFAAKVMSAKGWNDIKTSKDTATPESTAEEFDALLRQAAAAAKRGNVSEADFIKQVLQTRPDLDEKTLKQIYKDAEAPKDEE